MRRKKRHQGQLAQTLDESLPPAQKEVVPADDPLVNVAHKLATSEHPGLSAEKMEQIQARMLDATQKLRKSGRLYRFASLQRAMVVLTMMEVVLLIVVFVALLPAIFPQYTT